MHERALDRTNHGFDRSEMDSSRGLQWQPQSRRFTLETDEQAALVTLTQDFSSKRHLTRRSTGGAPPL
mgnify:FL=1